MSEIIRVSRMGPRCRQQVAEYGFTARKRQKFLDALALTCNVARSAEHAEIGLCTAYKRRAADPEFAALWRVAVEAGYDRLEVMVIESVGAGLALEPPDGDRAASDGLDMPFDFERALAVLRQYGARRHGVPTRSGGRPRTNATREDTNTALLKALAAVKKRLEATHDGGA